MAECFDKNFSEKLHLYELDLLSAEEKEKFELHLMQCDACFEELNTFREVAGQINRSPVLKNIVQSRLKSESESVQRAGAIRIKPVWRRAVPSLIVALGIIIVLILKPWQITITPTDEARASENRLIVMYFENLTDDLDNDKLAEIVTNLLITDLSHSEFIQVVSSQQLFHLLPHLDKPSDKIVDNKSALAIARKVQSRWLLNGTLLQTEPNIVISSQLVEVTSGDVFASEKITGAPGQDIFTLVDSLTGQIKSTLLPDAQRLLDPDIAVADITTHSPEAYYNYLKGVENFLRFYNDEASVNFRTALRLDSTFAMAYYYLARSVEPKLISKAVLYSERTSRREQLYIQSLDACLKGDNKGCLSALQEIIKRHPHEIEANFLLGQYAYSSQRFDEAIGYYNRVLEVDSSYKQAYNQLAYLYDAIGDLDKAIWAINKYIEIAPDEANPYDSRGDLYAYNGQIDRAIESYKKALQLKADFHASRTKLGLLYMYRYQYDSTRMVFEARLASSDPAQRAAASLDLSNVFVFEGDFMGAVKVLNECLATDMQKLTGDIRGRYESMLYIKKAMIFSEIGRCDSASRALDDYLAVCEWYLPSAAPIYEFSCTPKLFNCGDIERINDIHRRIKAFYDSTGVGRFEYLLAAGYKEFADGNYEAAVNFFEEIRPLTVPRSDFEIRYILGRLYLLTGDISRAVREFEKLKGEYTPNRLMETFSTIRLHYYLGMAYEESRWYELAAEQYGIFLDFWEKAEPAVPEIADARSRLDRIEKQP